MAQSLLIRLKYAKLKTVLLFFFLFLVLFTCCLNKEAVIDKSSETTANFFRGPVECGENGPGDILCFEKKELPKNSEISFGVGDVFYYETTGGAKDRTIYTVEGIETINGSDCFIVQRNHSFIGPSDRTEFTDRLWYDKNTGEVKKADLGYYPLSVKVAQFLTKGWFFSPWMLSLTDDFELEIRYNCTYEPGAVIKYQVVGREMVNGRECFKVKLNDVYLWIDIKKRILVKSSNGKSLISLTE